MLKFKLRRKKNEKRGFLSTLRQSCHLGDNFPPIADCNAKIQTLGFLRILLQVLTLNLWLFPYILKRHETRRKVTSAGGQRDFKAQNFLLNIILKNSN